jgi:hypothetical protein
VAVNGYGRCSTRVAHLLRLYVDEAVVHPVAHEVLAVYHVLLVTTPAPCRLALRDLVLVVRKRLHAPF